MIPILTKLAYKIRHLGVVPIIYFSAYRLFQKIIPIEVLVFFEKELQHSIVNQVAQIEVQFRKASQKDFQNLDADEYGLSGTEYFELNENYECYIACAPHIVSYLWVSYKNMYDENMFDLYLHDDEAYIYRAFTHPDYRGLNIYAVMLQHVCAQLQKMNKAKCYIATSIKNTSSRRGILKAGFTKLGHVFYFKVHRFKRTVMPYVLQKMATA